MKTTIYALVFIGSLLSLSPPPVLSQAPLTQQSLTNAHICSPGLGPRAKRIASLSSRSVPEGLCVTFTITFSETSIVATQQGSATLSGQVTDDFDSVVVGAVVRVTNGSGDEKTATTNHEGVYVFKGLAPGRYTVRAQASGFALYQNAGVDIFAGRREVHSIRLGLMLVKEAVTVPAEAPVSVAAENNAGALVLREADLDALPDDPEDLAAALRAMAGPSAGPGGSQIFIDGLTSRRLPPKSSIREIRINQNPFSAEYDRLGFGRIEILTKPGTEEFTGKSFFNFTDESLNSRNPFAPNRAPFQSRLYGGDLSGTLIPKRASFFVDFERREVDDNAVINATILDPALNITPFSIAVVVPNRRITFSPRVDYQLNRNNSLVARYIYERSSSIDGIGDFSLLSRAYDESETEQSIRLTETAVLGPTLLNETRFRFDRERRRREGDNSVPTIRVRQAFTGGGSQVGLSLKDEDQWELHDHIYWAPGRHALKAGGRLRGVHIMNSSSSNFGGTFTFAGGNAPLLDATGQLVRDANGQPILASITSIERYRRTLEFQRQGLAPGAIRALGGGATQFSIASGDPEARVSQYDFGAFVQDDWRLRPNLTLSLGLRYETQTNISSNQNFAPRIAFAWSPGDSRRAKTVLRGGFGIFYDRFSENFTLQANRFNGITQQHFIVQNPDFFPVVPSVETLDSAQAPQSIWRVADDLQAPYVMQSAVSVEQQLPFKITLSTTFINARMLNVLRSRNITAPLPGTLVADSGPRENIFQNESSGVFNQNQLIINANSRFNRNLTLFASYVFNKANSDTDGPDTFPANTYDLSGEYGRSALDVRHRFILGGSMRAPWGMRLDPLVMAQSGAPFNITLGRDINGDTLFTERPAFATDLTQQGVVVTGFGAFDETPQPGQVIIPRNFGEGPGFFSVNLRLRKTFNFGYTPASKAASSQPQGGGQNANDRGNARTGSRYSLRFSIQAQNLFNRTNAGALIGDLSSSLFGQSNSTAGAFGFDRDGYAAAGNRRIEAQIRFSF